jgi:hypothetical protein
MLQEKRRLGASTCLRFTIYWDDNKAAVSVVGATTLSHNRTMTGRQTANPESPTDATPLQSAAIGRAPPTGRQCRGCIIHKLCSVAADPISKDSTTAVYRPVSPGVARKGFHATQRGITRRRPHSWITNDITTRSGPIQRVRAFHPMGRVPAPRIHNRQPMHELGAATKWPDVIISPKSRQ